MELTMQSGGVPAGSYLVRFEGAEEHNERAEEYGPGVKLSFPVLGGPQDGQVVTRICSAKMTPKTVLGRFANALAGRQIPQGESVNFDAFRGIVGTLLCEPVDGGGSRATAFLRQEPQPQAVASPAAGVTRI